MSFIRKRFTFANVAMTLALVFAMSGGAYAAKKYLITSTKQISPKVLKQLKGSTGPTGPEGKQGPQGAAGANGKDGLNGKDGTNGTNGANGKSVVANAEAAGANCENGGSSFEVEGSKVKHYACNGKNGQTGFTETLPHGKTLYGAWSVSQNPELLVLVSISFGIPLPGTPNVVYVSSGKSEPGCPGTASNPQAEAGTLCVYESSGEFSSYGGAEAYRGGASLVFFNQGVGRQYGNGTWAVTAE